MPKRTSARLRELRTAEVWLEFYRERDRAFQRGLMDLREILASADTPEQKLATLQERLAEGEMNLRVIQRMHELRMQELGAVQSYPDES